METKVPDPHIDRETLMHHLCARQNIRFLNCYQIEECSVMDWHLYATDRHEGRIYVWYIRFGSDDILYAEELFVFEADELSEITRAPLPILIESLKLKKREKLSDVDRYGEGELQW